MSTRSKSKGPKTRSRSNTTKINGSRSEVWNGLAEKTKGGLHKKDLIKTDRGSIVSKRKQQLGKIQMAKMLNGKHADKFLSNQEKVMNGTL
jgi:hypothetical protein